MGNKSVDKKTLRASISIQLLIPVLITLIFATISFFAVILDLLPKIALIAPVLPLLLGIFLARGAISTQVSINNGVIYIEKYNKVASEEIRVSDITKIYYHSDWNGKRNSRRSAQYYFVIEDNDGRFIKINRLQYKSSDIKWLREYLLEQNKYLDRPEEMKFIPFIS